MKKNSIWLLVPFTLIMSIVGCSKDDSTKTIIETDTVMIETIDSVLIELPIITSISLSIDENSAEGTFIGNISYSGLPDGASFSILESSPEGAMQVDESSGDLFVADSALFDYEVRDSLRATVVVAEDTKDSVGVYVHLLLNDVNTSPIRVDESVMIDMLENPDIGSEVYAIDAYSAEATLNYRFKEEQEGFIIDESSGLITIAEYDYPAFDYETAIVDASDTYILEVEVTDDIQYTELVELTINLQDTTIIWTGSDYTFTKTDYADWTLEANQDRITENVWITRQDSKSIFNYAMETGAPGPGCDTTHTEPTGSWWGWGTTEDIESVYFETFSGLRNCDDPSTFLLDKNAVLWIPEEDLYLDIIFISWTTGNQGGGGGFSYTRSTPQE